MLISTLINTLFQVVIVGLIPFVWWFISTKRNVNFSEWIGLKKIKFGKEVAFLAVLSLSLLVIISVVVINLTDDMQTATSQFKNLGIYGVIPSLIYAFIQTAFTEELFFRGFLLKRLKSKFNFAIANIVQSILFALLHCVMFINITNVFNITVITALTGIASLLLGFINEKKANGSIVLSWIIHGVSNMIASFIALFNLI